MADNKAPVNDRGEPVTISLGHMSSTTRLIVIVALALGVGSGGAQIVGHAQLANMAKNPTTELRLSKLESDTIRCAVALDVLDKKIDILTQIATANYVATTVDDPRKRKAAEETTNKIKSGTNPLDILHTP